MNNNEQTILYLLSRSLFGVKTTLKRPVDYAQIFKEANAQTVSALIYNTLNEEERKEVPEEILKAWQTMFFQSLFSNEQILYEQSLILKLFQERNISFVLLKGTSVAKNYPIPALRVLGDIDLLVSEKDILEASEILKKEGYEEKVNNELHLGFYKSNVIVELHKKPVTLMYNENEKIEKSIQSFFLDIFDKKQIVDGVPIASNIHLAVILIMHKLTHFLNGELGLRQLCDWAMFVKTQLNSEIWKKLAPILDEFGIKTFTIVITKVCIDFLGLPLTSAEWANDCRSDLAKSVIELIIESGNFGEKISNSYGQRLFVDAHSKNRVSSFFKVLSSACRENWKPCANHPILMPIAPFVVYCKYLKLRKKGERKKLKLSTIYKRAGMRQKLYRELKPFVKTEDK